MRWAVTIAVSVLLLVVSLSAAFLLAYSGLLIINFDRPMEGADLEVARSYLIEDLGPSWPGGSTEVVVSSDSMTARRTWLAIPERTATYTCGAGTCDVPIHSAGRSRPGDHLQFATVMLLPLLLVAWAISHTSRRSRAAKMLRGRSA